MNELDITSQNQIKKILEKYHENEYDDDASSIGESLENSISSLEASQNDLSLIALLKYSFIKRSITNKRLGIGRGSTHQISAYHQFLCQDLQIIFLALRTIL